MAYIGKAPGGTGVRQRYLYTATSGQTTFTTSDSGLALSYSDTNYMDVYQNGVLLDPANDYTATSGTSVVLGTGATTGDVIEIIVYDVFSVFNNTVTGNFTVGNNLTVSGTSTLATVDINAGNIDGTTIGAATPAAGTFTTGSFTGDVAFGNNDITGLSKIISDAFQIERTNGEVYIQPVANQGVKLFWNGAERFDTTSTGVDVTGTITSDGLTVDGDMLITTNTGTNPALITRLGNIDQSLQISVDDDSVIFKSEQDETGRFGGYKFISRNAGTDTDRLIIDLDGNVGIGESNPVTPLTIATTNKLGSTFTGTTNGEGLTVTQTNYTAGNYISLVEAAYDDSFDGNPNVRIGAMFDGNGSNLAFGTSNSYTSGITNTAMFIDSDANVGIGKTPNSYTKLDVKGTVGFEATNSTNAWLAYTYTDNTFRLNYNGAGNDEVTIDSSGNVGIGTSSTTNDAKLIVSGTDGKHPIIKVSDGGGNGYTLLADNYTASESQINFGISYSGAGAVISRGVKVSDTTDNVYLSSQALYATKPTALKLDGDGSFRFLNTNTNATTAVDTAVSLTERMRILSGGGITFNGDTAAANALSDYEEGTFNPFSGIGSAFTGETTKNARYRKIGKLVHVDCRVTWTATDNSSNNFQLTMPFNSANVSGSEAGSAAHTGTVFYSGTAVESGNAVSAHMSAGDNSVTFYSTAGGSFSSVRRNEVNGTYDWLFSITYPTDA